MFKSLTLNLRKRGLGEVKEIVLKLFAAFPKRKTYRETNRRGYIFMPFPFKALIKNEDP